MVYTSITGLELKSVFHAPAFWWHAVRSLRQAQSAPGLISADARQINGIHHSLTVWETKAAMRTYLTTCPLPRVFHPVATGARWLFMPVDHRATVADRHAKGLRLRQVANCSRVRVAGVRPPAATKWAAFFRQNTSWVATGFMALFVASRWPQTAQDVKRSALISH